MRPTSFHDPIAGLARDGYLLLTLPQADGAIVRSAIETAREFFRQPAVLKQGQVLPYDCGYRESGIEFSKAAERPDPMESFTACTRNRGARLPSPIAQSLHECLLHAYAVLEPIAESLTRQILTELSGDVAAEQLRGAFHRWSCVQLNYARPATTAQAFINELHEDGHLLTLGCSTGKGLELQTPSGIRSITALPGEVVVMPGEIAALLSGGAIKPLYHQVRSDPDSRERLSLLFFGDIDPRLCTPWVRNAHNADVDIGARVLTNAARFGLQGLPLE